MGWLRTYRLLIMLSLVAMVAGGCAASPFKATPSLSLAAPPDRMAQREARLDELERFVVFAPVAPAAPVVPVANVSLPVNAPDPTGLSLSAPVPDPPTAPMRERAVSMTAPTAPVAAQPIPDPAPKPVPVAAPIPVLPVEATPATPATRHTVVSGDTLGHIAQKYLGDARRWEEIWNVNPSLIDPARLRIGQSLTLPQSATPDVAPAPAPTPNRPRQAPELPPGHLAHTVAGGDSIRSLARRYLGDPGLWTVLARANPELKAPYTIYPGQVLAVPKGAQVERTLMAIQVAAVPPGKQGHTVRSGDTLGAIARHYLGDAALWRAVMDANPSLSDPHAIRPGRVLVIPSREVVLSGHHRSVPPDA